MKILRNYVKVKFDPYDKIGRFYVPDEMYLSSPIRIRSGIVELTPDRLTPPTEEYHYLAMKGEGRDYNETLRLKEISNCLDYDFPMILQEGDRVFWKYNIHQDDYYTQELIKYDQIIVAERNGEIIPLHGYVIAEAIKKETERNGIILSYKNEKELNKSVIKHIGLPCLRYKYFPHYKDSEELQVGDTIWHNASTGISIEYSLLQKLDRPYIYLNRKDVLKYERSNS